MKTDDATALRILREGPLRLGDLTRHCPRPVRGKRVHTSSLARWARHGRKGIRLEAFHDGRGWVSSVQALARFYAALTVVERGQLVPEVVPEPGAGAQALGELLAM